jgi:UDP-N-acetylmuramoyl-tripeptide--D-alanyl-D-alanine ligase
MIETVLYPLFLKFPKINTDTRAIEKDAIFFALKGANFDGNKFAEQALSKGAAYAVIDDQSYLKDERYILVDDVLKTLQDLASYHRNYLDIPIISLTGSNGKTTTKELINAVLSEKYHTVATKGNLNNHIGVPLTLLAMDSKTEIGIVELGANHPKEIEFLVNIAKPNFGLITNFGKAHLEGFGSFEGVIKTKTELYDYLKSHDELAFVNSMDNIQLEKSNGMKRVLVGQKGADINVDLNNNDSPFVTVNYNDMIIQSNMIGAYNFNNIAFAITIGSYFKVSDTKIKDAISKYKPSNNRSQVINKGTNTILLDAYNANPTSMQAALENFKNVKASKKQVFLGDMFELGNFAKQEHQNIVDLLEKYSLEAILIGENFYNTETSSTKIKKYKTFNALTNQENLNEIKDSFILIKGSRGMKLERLLDYLD